jgi:hypothetical protein
MSRVALLLAAALAALAAGIGAWVLVLLLLGGNL